MRIGFDPFYRLTRAAACVALSRMARFSRVWLRLVLVCAAFTARADVKLAGLFSDNMVLQRRMRAPVWGWADEGEKVTVTFRGASVSATAKGSKWIVKLPGQNAGGPDRLIVEGKNKIELKNVLVGEVWICSGQSNMEFPLNKSFDSAAEIAASANPQLRLCVVPKTRADAPRDDAPAPWKECQPETVGGFSAVAYY